MPNSIILGGTDSFEWVNDVEALASTNFRTYSIKLRMLARPPNDTTFWTIFVGHRISSFGRLGGLGVAQNGFYLTQDAGARGVFGSVATPGTGYDFFGTDYFPINKDIVITFQTSETSASGISWAVDEIRGTASSTGNTTGSEDGLAMGFDNDSGDKNTGAKVAIYWVGIWDGDVAVGKVNDEVHHETFVKGNKPQEASHPASSTNGLLEYIDIDTSGLRCVRQGVEPTTNTGKVRFGYLT